MGMTGAYPSGNHSKCKFPNLPAGSKLGQKKVTDSYKHSSLLRHGIEQHVNNCLHTNISSYLETSGGQSSNLYLNVIHFFKTSINQTLWQLKTVVFLHWCLICAHLLLEYKHFVFLETSGGQSSNLYLNAIYFQTSVAA